MKYYLLLIGIDLNRNVNKVNLNDYDYIIMTSSIICHETEIKVLKKITDKGSKVFVTGIFANTLKSKYNSKYSTFRFVKFTRRSPTHYG